MGADRNDIAVLSRCRQQLVAIKDLPTILEIRNKAQAIASYQQACKEGHDVSNQAKLIVAFAEARAGQEIQRMQDDGELDSGDGGDRKSPSQDASVMTLSDLDITYSDSSRFKLAAEVLKSDESWFDAHVAECNGARKDFTQQAVVRKGQEIRNARLGKKEVRTPRGKYDVLVIDPPWEVKKIERDAAPDQVAFDYPTMTEDELAAMELPAADACHLWCWATHKFLPMALRLVAGWQFKYVCAFVWHKPGGFQPFGLPQYNCEFALYARRGTPEFTSLKDFPACFNAPRGAHSEKPGEFYEMVRRVTDGKRLDMFSRRKITGFKGWGNESK